MLDNISKIAHARVLVVGDVMLDRYWMGNTNRISPEAPVPVISLKKKNEFPGGAGNVARNIAALEGNTQLVSMIGNDDTGAVLVKLLQNEHILFDHIKSDKVQTTTKLRVVSQNQQLLRLDFEDEHFVCDQKKLYSKYIANLEDVDVVILSDYAKGVLRKPIELIRAAKERNIPVLVDPKGQKFSKYQGATVLTPNRKEFEAVVGSWDSLEELAKKARELMNKYDFGAVIVTLGQDGMVLIQQDSLSHIPAFTEEVYDVTGAGDTVIALLGCAIGKGLSLQSAMEIANLGASLVVKKFGAATITLDELMTEARQHSTSGIVSFKHILGIVADEKAKGRKIVMTNGCFDVVHAGHISYLKEAKALGDILIVAVNDDASVSRLKGSERPIHNLQHRQEVLAELQSVDWVISFSEDTPARIIDEILPDVLVKGGDYTIETIVGADRVLANGGQVKVLNFKDNLSTSNILNKLR